MNSQQSLEDELWDDSAAEHPKIYHALDGGRVVWVANEEFRCFKCGERVDEDNMFIPDEPILNGVR